MYLCAHCLNSPLEEYGLGHRTRTWKNISMSDIAAKFKTVVSVVNASLYCMKFTLYRPVLSTDGSLTFSADIDIDFQDSPLLSTAGSASVARAVWDQSLWDVGLWAGSQDIVKQWTSPAEWQGYAASGKVQVSTNALTIQWMANDIVWESGGIV